MLTPGWVVPRSEAGVTAPPAPLISSRKENVHRHVLRLLLHLHARVAPSKLEALQKALEPTGQSGEAVKELYSQLGEKLEQLDHRKPSPTQAAETPALDLPLPSVPAPATL